MATICARCGEPIDHADEDLCVSCLATMPNVAMAVPDDMADPDRWEDDRPPPEGVHFASYPLVDHWNVNEFESIQLRRALDDAFVVIHHFSNYEDSFWRQYGGPLLLESSGRMIAQAHAAALRMEEAQAEAEARGE